MRILTLAALACLAVGVAGCGKPADDEIMKPPIEGAKLSPTIDGGSSPVKPASTQPQGSGQGLPTPSLN